MFTINGSVYTVGPDNKLPIDALYDFKRYCHKFLLQNNTNNQEFIIKDDSPYSNYITYLDIQSSLEQNQDPSTSKPAFYFNGNTSYISSTCNNIISLNNLFTISFWINTSISSLQNNSPRCIFKLGNETVNNSLVILLSEDGNTASNKLSLFNFTNSKKTIIIKNTTKDISDSNWHHVEISRDINNNCTLFIDGKVIGSNTITTTFGNHYTDCLRIGSINETSGYFNGYISDFYILDGICEHSQNFEVNNSQHLLPLDTELRYSGMVTHVQVNETVKKYDLLYYNPDHRSYMISDCSDINTLPVQGIAIEDGTKNSTIKMLTYGTICLNSSDITDENQEYNTIIPLTQNENNSFIISSTSGTAANLITSDNHNSYLTETNYYLPGSCQNHQHHWFKIKLNKPQLVKYYSLEGPTTECTINWKLKGSVDGLVWVLLDSQNNQYFAANEVKIYSLPINETEYQYYEFYDMDHNIISKIHLLNINKEDVIPTFGEIYFTITSDTNETNCDVYKISDNDDTTYWSPSNNSLTGTIICDFGCVYNIDYYDHVTINKFAITCNNVDSGKQIYVPSVFELFGSNNNEDWNLLYHFDHNEQDIPWTNYGDRAVFDLTEDTHYRYYKLIIYSCTPILNGDLPTTLKITNFELLNIDQNIIPINSHYKRKIFKTCSKQVIITDNGTTYNPDTAPGNVFNYVPAVLNNKDNFYPRWNLVKTQPYILNIDFGDNNSKQVNSYSITPVTSSNYPSSINMSYPKTWTFQGSNNNSQWDTLDTRSNITFGTSTLTYNITSPSKYRYYRLNITATSTNNQVSIAQLHLFDSDGNDIISCNGYGKYFYTEYENYLYFKQAEYSIEAPERDDTQNNCKANQLLNNSYSFNSTDEKWHQYCTADNQLTPTITITFPDKLFSMWNNLIDGYVIRSGINVTNPKSFRYPSEWTIEGLRKYWDLLDTQTQITFNPNERKYFQLDEEQIGITGIRINITKTTGSTEVIPPNYLHLMEFYPTYKGYKLDLPIFNGISKPGFNTKILNNSVCYSSDKLNVWECSWSSSTAPFFGHSCLDYLNSNYWSINNYTLNSNTDSQYDIKDSIHINTKIAKHIIAYGIYLAQQSLTGNSSYIPIISWKLFGSNDNVNWDLLHEVNPLTEEEAISSWPIIYKLQTTKSYKFYKFDNINRGCIRGIDFYSNTNIINSKKLTISHNNKGQISDADSVNINNQLETYYIQNLGYTGLTFKSAIEEYSVAYFDFNKQIEIVNPNLGDYSVSDTESGLIGHKIVDGPLVTLLCDNLHIFPNQILTCAASRCRGLRIIVKNDCIIDGSISMDCKGSFYSPLWTEDFPIITEQGNILAYIPRYGASGAIDIPTTINDRIDGLWTSSTHNNNTRQYGKNGISGIDGINRQTGGGGSGAAISGNTFVPVRGGNGGCGTCFGGGSGGGSFYGWGANSNSGHNLSGVPGINNSGIGGASYSTLQTYYNSNGSVVATNANNYPGVPGAGTPTGNHLCTSTKLVYSQPAITGSGGLIILIVYGNLWLNLGSSITANGTALNQYKSGATSIIGGAGSGGGSINIFYGGLFINNGLITANGGISSNTVNGGKGGDGCITIDKLN